MVKELAEHFDEGKQLSDYPYEMLDENKWLASRHGLEGELVDLPDARDGDARRRSRGGSTTGCASTRRTSARPDELEGVLDLLEHGNGAYRQRKVYEANRDFTELLQDIVAATAP